LPEEKRKQVETKNTIRDFVGFRGLKKLKGTNFVPEILSRISLNCMENLREIPRDKLCQANFISSKVKSHPGRKPLKKR
jgi:hypothetical protein